MMKITLEYLISVLRESRHMAPQVLEDVYVLKFIKVTNITSDLSIQLILRLSQIDECSKWNK